MKVQKLIFGTLTFAILSSFSFKQDETFGGQAKGVVKNPKGGIREVTVETECQWKSESDAKKNLFGTLKQVILQDERVIKVTYEVTACK